MPAHRVAAIVLTDLACQLAYERHAAWAQRPLAVLLEDGDGTPSHRTVEPGGADAGAVSGAGIVFAVDARARACGVRPGMQASAAMARTADLAIARVGARAIHAALGVVAEVALEFGATVEVALWDTVWVDVTGGAHLFGGEARLCDEIVARLDALGWAAEVAISDGPELARAVARFGAQAGVGRVVPVGQARDALAPLPVGALPVDVDAAGFFARLGVLTLGDLMRIERAQLTGRLDALLAPHTAKNPRAPDAKQVLGWLDGHDHRPLVPYVPPTILTEQVAFEDGVETAGQIVFALRGVVSRLSLRLTGRRQAAGRLDLLLHYDRTIYRLRAIEAAHPRAADVEVSPSITAEPWATVGVDLPSPLCHTEDLFRAVKAKLESLVFAAPVVRLEIALSRIDRSSEVQLDLSRDVSVDPDALPALLSELSAEMGPERIGVLAMADDHRPELRTRLEAAVTSSPTRRDPTRAARRKRRAPGSSDPHGRTSIEGLSGLEPLEPTRLLRQPVALGCSVGGDGRLPALRPGVTLSVGRDAFVVESIRFDRRMDGIAWWSSSAASRDYLRVVLVAASLRGSQGPRFGGDHAAEPDDEARPRRARSEGGTVVAGPWGDGPHRDSSSTPAHAAPTPRGDAAEAWVYVDRRTGEVFLQGWWE